MRVWLPYVIGGSGTDTFTVNFASQLETIGYKAIPQAFPHWMQYAPDILRGVEPPADIDVMLTNSRNGFAFKRKQVPMVTMEQLCVHEPEYAAFRSPGQGIFHRTLVYPYEKRSFAVADRVVAVSEATRRAVASAFEGVDPTVIYNGVDTEYFSPPSGSRTEHWKSRPDGRFRLLFVGNLTKRKGADILREVMKGLGSNFVLSYTSGLREKARLDVENSIPLGKLDPEGVRAAYREADALLFPTRLEGLPIAVLEAMSCGLPVVASNRSSMPEVVSDGETGLMCELDPDSFVDAVTRLAEDDDLRMVMATAARERAVVEFDIGLMVARYLKVFDAVSKTRT